MVPHGLQCSAACASAAAMSQAQVGGIYGSVKIINHKMFAGDGYRMNKVQKL